MARGAFRITPEHGGGQFWIQCAITGLEGSLALPDDILLAIIVRDAGLRSLLAARLSMAGVDLVTGESFATLKIPRRPKQSVVLIADQAAADAHEGGAAGLVADPRWRQVVLIADAEISLAGNPRMMRVRRAGALAAIAALLPDWIAR